MARRLHLWLTAALTLTGPASAADCTMQHATYSEPRSGALLQFQPLPTDASPSTNNVFTLSFPNAAEGLTGDVTWTNGRRSLPLMTVRHACTRDDIDLELQDGTGLCRLWDGSAYALHDGSADWIPDAGEPAPKGLLLPDFGDALVQWPGFYTTNADRPAWDAFTLTACAK